MKPIYLFSFLAGALGLASCHSNSNKTPQGDTLEITVPQKANFTDTVQGKQVSLYTLQNHRGMSVYITNYGGRIVALTVPDKTGKTTDVVVGFGTLKAYTHPLGSFYGALIGRVGNRIAKGKFTLDGKQYALAINNPPNSLHGGAAGYQDLVWDAVQPNDSTLELSYLSKDGEGGYPGNLNIKVTYSVSEDNALKINYQATTDKKTIVNLTNHSYFNLNGAGSGTILNHLLQINADRFTPVNSTLIPTGELASVAGTPFDFRTATAVGQRIEADNQQLKFGKGYDHNFVLNSPKIEGALLQAATLTGDKSGIVMNVITDQPRLQVYTGNFMDGSYTLLNGAKDSHRTAICLETQHFPDSPNHNNFPSIVLEPGQKYETTTVYKFSVSEP
jgi:aldose 1-epimerase